MILAAVTQAELEADRMFVAVRKDEAVWVFHDIDPGFDRPKALILSIRELPEDECES